MASSTLVGTNNNIIIQGVSKRSELTPFTLWHETLD